MANQNPNMLDTTCSKQQQPRIHNVALSCPGKDKGGKQILKRGLCKERKERPEPGMQGQAASVSAYQTGRLEAE
eukprot:scaffold267525_cov19-Tisochrysis_lutea.AAC.1